MRPTRLPSTTVDIHYNFFMEKLSFSVHSACPRLPSSASVRIASSTSTHAWGLLFGSFYAVGFRPRSQASRRSIRAASPGIETKRRGRGCRAYRNLGEKRFVKVPSSPELPAGTRHTDRDGRSTADGLLPLGRPQLSLLLEPGSLSRPRW